MVVSVNFWGFLGLPIGSGTDHAIAGGSVDFVLFAPLDVEVQIVVVSQQDVDAGGLGSLPTLHNCGVSVHEVVGLIGLDRRELGLSLLNKCEATNLQRYEELIHSVGARANFNVDQLFDVEGLSPFGSQLEVLVGEAADSLYRLEE